MNAMHPFPTPSAPFPLLSAASAASSEREAAPTLRTRSHQGYSQPESSAALRDAPSREDLANEWRRTGSLTLDVQAGSFYPCDRTVIKSSVLGYLRRIFRVRGTDRDGPSELVLGSSSQLGEVSLLLPLSTQIVQNGEGKPASSSILLLNSICLFVLDRMTPQCQLLRGCVGFYSSNTLLEWMPFNICTFEILQVVKLAWALSQPLNWLAWQWAASVHDCIVSILKFSL